MKYSAAIRQSLLLAFSLLLGLPLLLAQGPPVIPESIPLDPQVRTGVLPNGLHYYIQQNKEPENRAELRLVVDAGSVLEDEDQQGLAHFVEHMAFNGSKNFKKSELVDYLESVGVKFGPHLNAYTSFDETVYMLQLPTDDVAILDKGLLVLQDWASGLSFEEEEIDKERGVVIEEWRLRSGAETRMLEEYMPVLVNGSRYADRLPIGKVDILESFEYATLKRFYEKWYRPDLMAVIAVGDFDPEEMEKKVIQRFTPLAKSENAAKRPYYKVPDHEEIKATVSTDPEARFSILMVNFKHDIKVYRSLADYREVVVNQLVSGMLTDRIEELKQKGESPIMFGGAGDGSLFGLRTKAAFATIGLLNADGIAKGTRDILTEVERIRRHGFIPSELKRQKAKLLSLLETRYIDRKKTESKDITAKLVQHFLTAQPTPGIEWAYKMAQEMVPEITIEEANMMAKELTKDRNAVITLTVQEKEGVKALTDTELLDIYAEIRKSDVAPYEEFEDDRPLLPQMPTAGTIAARTSHPGLGILEWQLSNGAKVLLKPTDYKDNEVKFMAFSPGGSSRLSDADFKKAWAAAAIIGQSGAGQFKDPILKKKLAGKVANIQPWIEELGEGVRGDCLPKDLETLLQLNYLYFTAPRRDQQSFNASRKTLSGFAAMSNSPEAAFKDSLYILMYQNHPRRQPLTENRVNELDLSASYMHYLDRFMDVNDFTFVLVGNFSLKDVEPLVTQYLASLPSSGRKERWKNRNVKAPRGVIEKEFKLGSDPKSMVNIAFTGPMSYSEESEYYLQSMTSVLRIMLRESLREEKGGVYGVRVTAKSSLKPATGYRIDIGFTCAPDRVDELVETAMEDIRNLQAAGPSEKNLQKVQETQRRSYETDMRNNKYWMDQIYHYFSNNLDINKMAGYPGLIDGLDRQEIQGAANTYLNMENYVKLVMNPEN